MPETLPHPLSTALPAFPWKACAGLPAATGLTVRLSRGVTQTSMYPEIQAPPWPFLSASHMILPLQDRHLANTFLSSLLCPVSKTIGQHTPVWPLKDS